MLYTIFETEILKQLKQAEHLELKPAGIIVIHSGHKETFS
jgi:hypothetical protein